MPRTTSGYALHHFGGLYLDADVEVLRGFDELLAQPSFMGFETGGDLEPAVIGAHPKTEWIGHCLRHYAGRNFILSDGSLDMQPLPLIVAETLRARYQVPAASMNAPVWMEDAQLMLYPARYFSPKNIHSRKTCVAAETYCIHHFDGQWIEKTWRHRIKSSLHRLLLTLVGVEVHRKVVTFVRTLRS